MLSKIVLPSDHSSRLQPLASRHRSGTRARLRGGTCDSSEASARASRRRIARRRAQAPSGGDIRARRRLNAATFEALQRAFDKGGQKAIDKVMRTQPAIFLKMLVLLVPRELQVEHSGSVKEMTDQQIEDAIAAIKAMIAEREAAATMIDVTPTSPSMPDAKSDPESANPLK